MQNYRPMPTHHIACDLGAESGRVMLGSLEAGTLALEEFQPSGIPEWEAAFARFEKIRS